MRIDEIFQEVFIGGFHSKILWEGFIIICYRKGSLGDRNGSPRNSPRHTAQSQVPHHRCHPGQDGGDDDDHCHSYEDDGEGNADENDQGHDDEKFKQGVVDMMIIEVGAMIADDRDAGG